VIHLNTTVKKHATVADTVKQIVATDPDSFVPLAVIAVLKKSPSLCPVTRQNEVIRDERKADGRQ
jgi:hypothetical protein